MHGKVLSRQIATTITRENTMAARNEEITGIFVREFQRWGDVALLKIDTDPDRRKKREKLVNDFRYDDYTTVKIQCDAGDLEYGKTYRFYGQVKSHDRYGDQFHATTFVTATPHSMDGVIRYLQTAPGVGPATARKLWELYRSDAVRILRENPDECSARVNGNLTPDRAREAASHLAEESRLESCTLDLMDLLGGRGFPKKTIQSALKKWGNQSADVIRRNPYQLMRFRGVGFLKADAMYLDLGLNPAKLKRQTLCAMHAIDSDNDGHTWHPVEFVERAIRSRISGAAADVPGALRLAKRAKLIDTRRDERGGLWIADANDAENERAIASHLAESESESACWPAELLSDSPLTAHQIEHLTAATRSTIGIFGGSPGTGKTFTAAQLVKVILASGLGGRVAVAAPTGKAASRITEAMRGYGIDLEASTIHSLLGVEKIDDGAGSGWSFTHGKSMPLPYRWLIIDEYSMVDASLFRSLLDARARGTHILLVGDVNQLPPVGRGAPLRDMIAAEIGYGELSEIQRNSGRIVRSCLDVKSGQRVWFSEKIDLTGEQPENLYCALANDPQTQIDKMLKVIEYSKNQGHDLIWDCQIVVAVNDKSPLSRKMLNRRLQAELNKSEAISGCPFRVGDKIVNTKNAFLIECDEEGNADRNNNTSEDGTVFVSNGELAEVINVQPTFMVAVTRPGEKMVKIGRGKTTEKQQAEGDTGCTWDLGYALTVHKSQGSEWPIVVVMLDTYPGAKMVCSREWFYTSISRAKRLCVCVGKTATVEPMIGKVAIDKRNTFLVDEINNARELAQAWSDSQCRMQLYQV
jgi:exodeoxyribonuclease V alpha subunit